MSRFPQKCFLSSSFFPSVNGPYFLVPLYLHIFIENRIFWIQYCTLGIALSPSPRDCLYCLLNDTVIHLSSDFSELFLQGLYSMFVWSLKSLLPYLCLIAPAKTGSISVSTETREMFQNIFRGFQCCLKTKVTDWSDKMRGNRVSRAQLYGTFICSVSMVCVCHCCCL